MNAIRKVLVGALIASAVLSGCATAPHAQTTFDYRIIKGYMSPAPKGRPELEPLLESAGAEGWEAVSWTQPGDSPPYFIVLLKRPKH